MADIDEILTYARLASLIIGVIGNVISFVVFLRPTFRKNSISTYFQALSISDLYIVWQLILDIYLIFYQTFIPSQTNFLCKLAFYIALGIASIPGWILVAFSVDKALSVRKKQIPILKKKWFQWAVVMVIVAFNCLFYLEIPINLNILYIRRFAICDLSTMRNFQIILIMNVVQGGLVPFVIMFVSSLIMIRAIFKSRKSVERAGKIDKHRKTKEIKFAISSITFNLMYVLFKLPIVILYLLTSYRINVIRDFGTFAIFLYFLNPSSGFFVHMISNSLFRREFLIICRLKRVKVDQTNSLEQNRTEKSLNKIAVKTADGN